MPKKVKTTKKVAKKKLTTLVHLLLDESGSMGSCLESTISGYNEYLKTLKKDDSDIVLFTFTKFNSSGIKVVHDGIDLKDVPELNKDTYQPDDLTPLYDAIKTSITAAEKQLKSNKDARVLFIIMTDGQENASKTTQKVAFDLIQTKGKEGWTFVYLGANQDSYAVGSQMGISKGNTVNYGTAKIKTAFRGLANSTTQYRGSTVIGQCMTFFTPEDKDTIEETTK